jgi:hypothetical protein
MKNTDKIRFVCFSTGGARDNGKVMGTKIRFTNDKLRFSKALAKTIGASAPHWVSLPTAMSKKQAVEHLRSLKDEVITASVYQDAIAVAAARYIPTPKIVSATSVPKA